MASRRICSRGRLSTRMEIVLVFQVQLSSRKHIAEFRFLPPQNSIERRVIRLRHNEI
jgi:hypothetical protein